MDHRKADTQILQSHKEDLSPTLAGILETEYQEGFKQGIRQMIVNLIENGFTDDNIAYIAKQTIEQIQAIRSGLEKEKL